MKFAKAVHNTPALKDAYQSGLQALKNEHHECITCRTPRLIAGSVDVDAALRASLPTAPRWDYAIGVTRDRKTDAVIWIEVHPASSTGEVKTMLNKLAWLKAWIAGEAPDFESMPREYVWVATGRVSIPAHSPQRRLLASQGLQFPGGRYNIQSR